MVQKRLTSLEWAGIWQSGWTLLLWWPLSSTRVKWWANDFDINHSPFARPNSTVPAHKSNFLKRRPANCQWIIRFGKLIINVSSTQLLVFRPLERSIAIRITNVALSKAHTWHDERLLLLIDVQMNFPHGFFCWNWLVFFSSFWASHFLHHACFKCLSEAFNS